MPRGVPPKSRNSDRLHELGGSCVPNISPAETTTKQEAMSHDQHGDLDTGEHVNARTTVFVEDANVAVMDYKTDTVTDDIGVTDQSIVNFMEKPIMNLVGLWSTASSSAASLNSFSIGALLSSNSIWAKKIEGFNLVRGTAVIRLQINANPFQQGKLYLAFLPNYIQVNALDPTFGQMHSSNLNAIMQLPGVELDCRETSCVLKVPYIAPTSWYDIKRGKYDWGTVVLYVVTPLKTGAAGQTSVEWSTYVSFEDFELAAPSVPQGPSGRNVKVKTFKRNPTEEEVKAVGSVSDSLTKVSGALSMVKDVPIIGGLAGTASWAASIGAGIASSFGWSKPRLETTPVHVSRQFNHCMANSDGVDPSMKLSILANNKVAITDKSSVNDEDEMTFAFLKKVASVTNPASKTVPIVNWTTASAVGTVLVSKTICPLDLCQQGTKSYGGHTAYYEQGAPVYYLANMFKVWRGSLRLVLKLIKTDFHTGRLMITWTPTQGTITTPVYNGNSQLALRHIIDIREGSEICLDLPYLHGSNYLDTSTPSGQIDISIINILRAPETCAGNVDILLYWSGGEDFELAIPKLRASNVSTAPVAPFYPQIGALDCSGIGDARIQKADTKYAESSIGEQCTSIRQLLSRASQVLFEVDWPTSSTSLDPYFRTSLAIDTTSGALIEPKMYGDVFNYVSFMYLYYRGGSRIVLTSLLDKTWQLRNTCNNKDSVYYIEAAVSVSDAAGAWSSRSATNTMNLVSLQEATARQVSAELPYYGSMKASLMYNNVTGTYSKSFDESQSYSRFTFDQNGSEEDILGLYRSFPDDFQLAYFIGAPPLLYDYT